MNAGDLFARGAAESSFVREIYQRKTDPCPRHLRPKNFEESLRCDNVFLRDVLCVQFGLFHMIEIPCF